MKLGNNFTRHHLITQTNYMFFNLFRENLFITQHSTMPWARQDYLLVTSQFEIAQITYLQLMILLFQRITYIHITESLFALLAY